MNSEKKGTGKRDAAQVKMDENTSKLDARAASKKKSRASETEEQIRIRLDLDAARKREKSSNESEKERQTRLDVAADKRREKKVNESEEERIKRLDVAATKRREKKANESDEKRRIRLDAAAAKLREKRLMESEDLRHKRLDAAKEYMRGKRSVQNSDELAEVRNSNAAAKRTRLANENTEQRQRRLETNVTQQRAIRASETPEESCARLMSNTQRRNSNMNRHISSLKEAADRAIENENAIEQYYCGKMQEKCYECKAKHFEDEPFRNKIVRMENGSPLRCKTYTKCCKNGQVSFEEPEFEYPKELEMLMKKESSMGVNFMENIRSINSSFAMASMGANIAPPPGHGPPCFRIHGQIYHRTGTMHPPGQHKPQYAQLYILDIDEANKQRSNHPANRGVDTSVFNTVADVMDKHNTLSKSYQMLYECEKEAIEEAERNGTPYQEVTMAIVDDRTKDRRRYNLAACNEVAIVFQNKDGLPPLDRDLLIYPRSAPDQPNKGIHTIKIFDKNLEAMVYPMLFPHGEQGWGLHMPKKTNGGRNKITMMDYYCYQLSVRDAFNPLLNAGRLTQQYIVDAYVKMEANRLSFIMNNQSEWRGDSLKGLQDYVATEAEAQGKKPGTVVILPSSFQGGPRYMQQNYQDAMAIVTMYGKPDLFVTMTCNPKWPEIQENLEPWQSAENRPDLVARVFNMKLQKLMDDIKNEKGGIFGKVTAFVYVIEFQKRGLPHAHILLILDTYSKLNTAEKIDRVVRAEIPDQVKNPRLFEIVTSHMVHGPCGPGKKSPCMDGDKCTKKFPRDFQKETVADVQDGYAKYQRRKLPPVELKDKTIDNRWVVPYNPYLLLRYNCHINVEVCSSVKCVKYIFKYIHKGHDCANVELKQTDVVNHNEIKKHVDSRYVSAPEAAWRMFGHSMHEQSHSVERLAVHLEGEQYVVFNANDESTELNDDGEETALEKVVEKAAAKHTTLTGWFALNRNEPEARNYYYWQTPLHYTWLKKERKWKIRERCFNKIGRMYTVSPKDPERFYLRILLLHVKGAVSFEDLRTHSGVTYNTYRESAKAKGLLEDDNVWQNTLNDAIACQMPAQLRQIFAYICAYCNPAEPAKLWNDNLADFTEDICHCLHQKIGDCMLCEDHTLKDVKHTLFILGMSLSQIGLREPQANLANLADDSYDPETEMSTAERLIGTLNPDQKHAFDTIVDAVSDKSPRPKCFFLDGPGGSGKSYLYETLLHYFRGQNKIVLPTASTGIAANLLEGGRTFHSMFGLGIPITENSVSRIKVNSKAADMIRAANLIVLDECTMALGHAVNTIERLCRDVMNNDISYGGKAILFGGDFRQCLAIVPHAKPEAIIQSSLKYCDTWHKFQTLSLKNNMRSEEPEYSEWLLKLGDGVLGNDDELGAGIIEIPEKVLCKGYIVNEIFGDEISIDNVKCMSKRAILCPKNESVDKINDDILNLITTEEHTYLSIDKIELDGRDNTEISDFPEEFVNSLTPSGMPPHTLKLKIGCVIMLLRNLNTKEGLCNGTRLFVTGLHANLIKAEVLTGSSEGKVVLIPRIELSPSNIDLPFKLTRRQFPVKVAFAMTINKSQGQTLEKVGIFLPDPVFGHGQLYVAFSRVRRFEDVRVKILDTPDQGRLIRDSEKVFTKNVVYDQIFYI